MYQNDLKKSNNKINELENELKDLKDLKVLKKEFPYVTIEQMRAAILDKEPYRKKTREEINLWIKCNNDEDLSSELWCPNRGATYTPCDRKCYKCGNHVFKNNKIQRNHHPGCIKRITKQNEWTGFMTTNGYLHRKCYT